MLDACEIHKNKWTIKKGGSKGADTGNRHRGGRVWLWGDYKLSGGAKGEKQHPSGRFLYVEKTAEQEQGRAERAGVWGLAAEGRVFS